jgi:hypothetical protein
VNENAAIKNNEREKIFFIAQGLCKVIKRLRAEKNDASIMKIA